MTSTSRHENPIVQKRSHHEQQQQQQQQHQQQQKQQQKQKQKQKQHHQQKQQQKQQQHGGGGGGGGAEGAPLRQSRAKTGKNRNNRPGFERTRSGRMRRVSDSDNDHPCAVVAKSGESSLHRAARAGNVAVLLQECPWLGDNSAEAQTELVAKLGGGNNNNNNNNTTTPNEKKPQQRNKKSGSRRPKNNNHGGTQTQDDSQQRLFVTHQTTTTTTTTMPARRQPVRRHTMHQATASEPRNKISRLHSDHSRNKTTRRNKSQQPYFFGEDLASKANERRFPNDRAPETRWAGSGRKPNTEETTTTTARPKRAGVLARRNSTGSDMPVLVVEIHQDGKVTTPQNNNNNKTITTTTTTASNHNASFRRGGQPQQATLQNSRFPLVPEKPSFGRAAAAHDATRNLRRRHSMTQEMPVPNKTFSMRSLGQPDQNRRASMDQQAAYINGLFSSTLGNNNGSSGNIHAMLYKPSL